MNISFSNFAFTIKQMKALMLSRKVNEVTLLNFIDHINNIIKNTRKPNFEKCKTKIKEKNYHLKKISSIIYHLKISFETLKLVKKNSKIAFYGIDPNRLDIKKNVDFQDNIFAHTAINSPELKNWFNKKNGDWVEIAFDPKIVFSYKSFSEKFNIPVITPLSVIIITILRFWEINILNAFKILKSLFKNVSPNYPSYKEKLISTLLIWSFLLGLFILFKRAQKIRMLCLTSNSTFLEILRSFIISTPNGVAIEILHGINTPTFDDYYLSYKKALLKKNKLSFILIPMLADPFKIRSEKKGGFMISKIPSNTGIFKVLKNLIQDYVSITKPLSLADTSLLTEVIFKKLGSYGQSVNPIFTIYGGTDLENDYYNSKSFNIEFELLEKLRNQLAKTEIFPEFIYFPHPKNEPLKSLRFSDGKNLTILYETQLSYFYADYAFGLYSSAIFESAAFGAKVFSPITPESNLMHQDMLNYITHPKNKSMKSLKESIAIFCKVRKNKTYIHKDKIKSRIESYFLGKI